MHRLFRLFIILNILIATLAAFSGCKEHTLISSKVSPANDTVGLVTMQLGCITHSFFNTDVETSINIVGLPVNQGVGAISDSFFGTTVASTFFQLANGTGITNLDTSIHVDSAYLVLPYSGFTYGDTLDSTITQSYQVFYMQDTIGYNSIYYPGSVKGVDFANPLSDPKTVNISRLKDSVTISGINYMPAMYIKLKLNTFLSKLNPALAASVNAVDQSQAFINAFNGICVRPTDTRTTTKAIPYFRLDGVDNYTEAGVLLYYHYIGDTEAVLPFYFSQGACAHFNSVTRSFSRYPLNNLFNSTQANDSIVAIGNQPGASIDVLIKGINSIPKGVVINKAELQLSLLPAYNTNKYSSPDQMFPDGIGSGVYPAGVIAGQTYPIADRYPLGSLSPYNVLDGYAHLIGSPAITTYTVDVPRELMACIANKNDTMHLHIRGTEIFYGAFRMIAGGGNYSDPKYRAKFNVVYSTLKN